MWATVYQTLQPNLLDASVLLLHPWQRSLVFSLGDFLVSAVRTVAPPASKVYSDGAFRMSSLKWECVFTSKNTLGCKHLHIHAHAFLGEARKGWKSFQGARRVKANTHTHTHMQFEMWKCVLVLQRSELHSNSPQQNYLFQQWGKKQQKLRRRT